MNHPLEQKIRAVTQRLQRLVLSTALARVVGWTMLAALLLGLADYLLRFQDPGIRLICSLVVLSTAIFTVLRYPYRAWCHRLSDLAVAQRVEQLYPELQGRMACALEFLQQEEDNPLAGSASLRRNVIASVTADAQDLDFSSIVNTRPFRRVFFSTGILVLVIAFITTVDARTVWTATVRLTQPLGQHDWPRRNRLKWESPPQTIARGAPFEVELIDENGNLPEEVTVYYRYQDQGGESYEEETIRRIESPSGPKISAFKAGVQRSFSFRAEGGDDDTMSWHYVKAVDPPQLVSTAITLHPPEYTGLSPYSSELRIRAVHGTGVAITGRSDKPLRAAWLVTDQGDQLEAKLSSTGNSFSIAKEQLIVKQSASYWFRLEDLSGISNPHPDRWNLERIADNPPSVSIVQPNADMHSTPGATIRLQISAKDDFSIYRVELLTQSEPPKQGTQQTITLWEGPAQVNPQDLASRQASGNFGDQRTNEHALDLRPLALQPGDHLLLLARATDYRGQEADSSPRHLIIISSSDFQTRIAKRQATILNRLARVLQWQREAQTRTRSVEAELHQAPLPLRDSLNDLQSAEVRQRQVLQALSNSTVGIPSEIISLLDEMSINHLQNRQTEEALRRLLVELNRLSQQIIPQVQNNLTTALKSLRSLAVVPENNKKSDHIAKQLDSVARGQEEIALALQQLLGDFEGWANRRQLLLEVKHLQEQQRLLISSTEALAIKQFTQPKDRDKPQDNVTLSALSKRQKKTAHRYDRFEYQMTTLSQQLRQASSSPNTPVHSALELSQQLGVAARMREASQRIEQGQAGIAAEIQRQAVDDLQKVIETLSGLRAPSALKRLENLQSAENELQHLREAQAGLRAKLAAQKQSSQQENNPVPTEETRQALQRLRREQQQWQQKLDQLTQRLKRLKAAQAAADLEKASQRSQASGQSLAQEDAPNALEHAQDASQLLDAAQAKLAAAIKKAKSDLDQLASIKREEEVQGLLLRQQSLISETKRLALLLEQHGEWSRAQAASVQDAANQQLTLAQDAEQLSKTLFVTPVSRLTLTEYHHDASRAAALLAQLETGTETQTAQEAGARRLQLLLAVLSEKNRQGLESQNKKQAGDSSKQGQGPSSRDRSYELAELKLLKGLQVDLNQRTRLLEEDIASYNEPSAKHLEQSKELQLEQGRLAEITVQIAAPAETSLPPTSDDLPDLSEQLEQEDDLPPLDLDPIETEKD